MKFPKNQQHHIYLYLQDIPFYNDHDLQLVHLLHFHYNSILEMMILDIFNLQYARSEERV